MKLYLPIAKVDAAQRLVYGYASTEARDDQGEVIKREAMEAALGDYMKFANIREMHQLSAVGKAKEAAVDEHGLYVGAKVVDDDAWEKVIEGVYTGYSIGGKVTARDPADRMTITGLKLDEISLVDRPANPEAVFDCWKRAADPVETNGAEPDPLARAMAALAEVQAQIDAIVKAGDKPYGDVKYADPGYQDDKKKRYPIDSEAHIRAAWSYINKTKNSGKYSAEQVKSIKAKIVAAWKDKIDPKGPPSADDESKAAAVEMQKALSDVGGVAQVILSLDWLKDMLETEAAMEGDSSPQPGRLGGIIDELCGFLNALVAEETAELKDGGADEAAEDGMAMAAIAMSLKKSGLDGRALMFDGLAKAKHSAGDQALLDVAHAAAAKAAGMAGISASEKEHCDKACAAMKAAGANATQDTARNPAHPAPQDHPPSAQYRPGQNATQNTAQKTAEVLELIEAALGKRGGAHQALMDVAHGCLDKLSDGKTCAAAQGAAQGDQAGKAGARHSQETMGQLQEAHDHLCAAGAKCAAAGTPEEEGEGTETEAGKAATAGDLRKALSAEKERGDTLAKGLGEVTARLDQIGRTVEQIARTPLPPLTRSAAGLSRIEKGADSGNSAVSELSDEELSQRIAQMTPDEQAMLLIKAAHRRPIYVAGIPGTAAAGGTPNG